MVSDESETTPPTESTESPAEPTADPADSNEAAAEPTAPDEPSASEPEPTPPQQAEADAAEERANSEGVIAENGDRDRGERGPITDVTPPTPTVFGDAQDHVPGETGAQRTARLQRAAGAESVEPV